ncbi:ABC transporter ATP-binding protein [Sphingomonas sp.]|uniref:ABC transporter ATP-binding protein n=1 Tax=Sphingomonas sp. TaxID=28214 RepID=UPI0035BC6374
MAAETQVGGANGAGAGPIIRVHGLSNAFGDQVVHENLDLEVRRGEILGVVGGSGTGKSVLMRSIIGLQTPVAGEVEVFGENTLGREATEAAEITKRWGVLFQGGALFSTLTVAENVQVPLREFYPDLPVSLLDEIASYKVVMTGLPGDAGPKFPAELSGGMRKRAGLARALALDPELLFLDEPTAGLDPIGAAAFDELTKSLQRTLGLTVFLITHDLDTLYAICDRVAVLADKKVIAVGTIDELLALDHPWIEEYFKGPRGRAAVATQQAHKTADAEPEAHPTEVKAEQTGQRSQGSAADNNARGVEPSRIAGAS